MELEDQPDRPRDAADPAAPARMTRGGAVPAYPRDTSLAAMLGVTGTGEHPAAPERHATATGRSPEPSGSAATAVAALARYDILPAEAVGAGPDQPSAVGRWTVAGVLAVVLALVVGTVVVGLTVLSGGGTQPEQLVPSTAFAFAKVDLDPAAGQKLDAIRFLRSFPQVKDSVGSDSDLRQVVFDATAPQAKKAGVDYDTDVKPWLGSRLGVAVLPPASSGGVPEVLGVLQVTDEGKARATLTRLKDSTPLASTGFVLKDGWALVAPSDAQARAALAAAQRSPLSSSAHYAADLKRLGEDGLATAWVDAGAAAVALKASDASGALGGVAGVGGLAGAPGLGSLTGLGFGLGSAAPTQGRLVYALRFAGPKVLEVTGFETGTAATAARHAPVRRLSTLPATTVAAFGATGLDTMTDRLWAQVEKLGGSAGGGSDLDQTVSELKTRYGISLPADLATLFGAETTLALDSTGLSAEGTPGLGVRAVTDPAAGTALAQKVARALGSGAPFQVVAQRTGDGYVLASTTAQAARMAESGTLGERSDFRAALPDVATAQVALFVDVDGLTKAVAPDGKGSAVRALEQVDAVGFTAAVDQGSATYRIRLVVH